MGKWVVEHYDPQGAQYGVKLLVEGGVRPLFPTSFVIQQRWGLDGCHALSGELE